MRLLDAMLLAGLLVLAGTAAVLWIRASLDGTYLVAGRINDYGEAWPEAAMLLALAAGAAWRLWCGLRPGGAHSRTPPR